MRINRVWPKHRAYVKTYACCVPGCYNGPIVFAHKRTAANAGTGLKPFDWFGISLCDYHHRLSHQKGDDILGIDWFLLASDFATTSPDEKMKEAMAAALPPGFVLSLIPLPSPSGHE